jgi:hypothetical protein
LRHRLARRRRRHREHKIYRTWFEQAGLLHGGNPQFPITVHSTPLVGVQTPHHVRKIRGHFD